MDTQLQSTGNAQGVGDGSGDAKGSGNGAGSAQGSEKAVTNVSSDLPIEMTLLQMKEMLAAQMKLSEQLLKRNQAKENSDK